MITVFVYGTLRSGGRLHRYMSGAKYLGTAMADGTMFSLGRYPGVHFEPGKGIVHGEIYQVDKRLLDNLDALEGYFEDRPEISMYVRRKITPWLGETHEKPTWAYEYRQTPKMMVTIPDGDWIKWAQENGV